MDNNNSQNYYSNIQLLHKRNNHHHHKHHNNQRGQHKLNTKCCCKKTLFSIVLTGDQLTNKVDTPAIGQGYAYLCHCYSPPKLYYKIKFQNLKAPLDEPDIGIGSVHFHNADVGKDGNIVKNIDSNVKTDQFHRNGIISGIWSSDDNFQPLTNHLISRLLNDGIYIILHTKYHPDGEIRGQLFTIPDFHINYNN